MPEPVAHRLAVAAVLVVTAALPASALAQTRPTAAAGSADSAARLRVTVRQGERPVEGALVRALDLAPPVGAQTDARGTATLRLSPGDRRLVVSRLGARPDTLSVTLRG
jgi:hypothetical protein